jgi:hypothetical protein
MPFGGGKTTTLPISAITGLATATLTVAKVVTPEVDTDTLVEKTVGSGVTVSSKLIATVSGSSITASSLAGTSFMAAANTYSVSDTVVSQKASVMNGDGTAVPLKVAEVTLPTNFPGGAIRVKFTLYGESGENAKGAVYRNGVAVGVVRETTDTTPKEFSEDIAGWAAGDKLQLYLWTQAPGSHAAHSSYIKWCGDAQTTYNNITLTWT